MWRMVVDSWEDVWFALQNAAWTTTGAVFGKRTYDGKVVTLGGTRWFPKNRERALSSVHAEPKRPVDVSSP